MEVFSKLRNMQILKSQKLRVKSDEQLCNKTHNKMCNFLTFWACAWDRTFGRGLNVLRIIVK